MSKDLNIVQINDPKIGKYSIILDNDQLKEIGKSGAKIIETTGESSIPNTPEPMSTSSGRIDISPDSQENFEEGFIGNDINWFEFFPNEDNAKVPELLEKAKKWEDNFELALTALTTFIGAGLGSYVSGNLTNFKDIPVNSVIGPFIDLYTQDHSKETKDLKKLIEDINSIQEMLNKKTPNE